MQKIAKSQKSIRRNNSIVLGFGACTVRRLCDVGASKEEVSWGILSSTASEVVWAWSIGYLIPCILTKPSIWTKPVSNARKLMKWKMFSCPVAGWMKKFVAMADRNRGERLKSAILAPEARPIWLGNNLEAANKDEQYLNIEYRELKNKMSNHVPKLTKTECQGQQARNRKRNNKKTFEKDLEDCEKRYGLQMQRHQIHRWKDKQRRVNKEQDHACR